MKIECLDKVISGQWTMQDLRAEGVKIKEVEHIKERFLALSPVPFASFEEALKKHPFALRRSQLENWIKDFKLLGTRNKDAVPGGFVSWIKDIVLAPPPSNINFLNKFETKMNKGKNIFWQTYEANVTALPSSIPTKPYSLVVIDPPYGLNIDTWDQAAFSRPELASIFNSFQFIDSRFGQPNFILTLIIFCSHEQLGEFIAEIKAQGYPYDVMVWCKRNVTPQSEYLFFPIHLLNIFFNMIVQ